METEKKELHIIPPSMVVKAVTIALAAITLLALVASLKTLREYQYVGAGLSATNTISISGEGEVFAVPDLATFTVSVQEEAKEAEDAQRVATQKTNDIIAALKRLGVEERDIKTTGYNLYPRYEWRETSEGIVRSEGERVLVGFEVSQSLEVKVRNTDDAGMILAEAGKLGASNVSGLSFTIDDEDDLKRDAREQAIADAEEKAQALARDLGVDLVRIVGFSEGGLGYQPPIAYARMETVAMDSVGGAVPELPLGENKITSQVTITYEIR